MGASRDKVGLWLIGATGGIGSTVALGLAALRRGRATTAAMVTGLPVFAGLDLPEPGALVVGGHEIRRQTLLDAVRESHALADLFDGALIRVCAPELRAMQRNIRIGTLHGANRTIRALADGQSAATALDARASALHTVRRLARDLDEFRRRNRLDAVVVINVASSEPPVSRSAAFESYAALARSLRTRSAKGLPASSLYALAAIETGCVYVNFTPSLGIDVPALQERAAELGALYMGRDGKTGETLIKSVLAPMFAMRNLRLLSWVGHNILGNRDGQVLADPLNRAEKIKSKDGLLPRIVGYQPDTRVSIEYVRSLSDWKVAWDFIHFEGFLGTRMNMQFTWCGSDSVLAAPLVIDLARLGALAQRRGQTGAMRHLACFFKNPMGVDEHDYFSQWQRLLEHVGVRHKAETLSR